ncbi:MAG: hypothetical protein HOD11_11505 [Candidatus Marinimicrobia bacterium]|nr:hypothetical protein [Candidatus Neomarinimicrobiota bacterium]
METLQMRGVTPVLRTPFGFLVSPYQKDEQEVTEHAGELKCNCTEATLSGDSKCQHTLAIQQYLTNIPGTDSENMIDQATADYYLSRIASLDEAMATNDESAKSQRAMIELWLEKQTESLERRRSFYSQALESWMLTNQLTSKRLVNGSVCLRKQQPEIDILDEEAVLQDKRFVRAIPEKLAINKAALRQYVVATGEEIPGISVHLPDAKFSYKINTRPTGAKHGLE